MFQKIVSAVCLVAVISEFYSILLGWLIISLPVMFLLVTLFSLRKGAKGMYFPELSNDANRMLQKFCHYYAMPFAGRDLSGSASTVMFAGVAVAVIGIFQGFWWGLGIAALNWIVMGITARAFNPASFLVDDSERIAHDEIISYITEKRKEKEGT
jgi:hypothetical protein